jgi:hypothetical protein
MLILHNFNLPSEARIALGLYGDTADFSAKGLVYDAVSGHPDLFFVQIGNKMMVPANVPQYYVKLFNERQISYMYGGSEVGFHYPESARYNAVITEKYFIHNLKISDNKLLEEASGHEKIHVNQGYTRCNLLALGETHFLTSDRGIYKTLQRKSLNVMLVESADIVLPGFKHGFFGGTCGVWQKNVFICGNLNLNKQGDVIRQFISNAGYSCIELYDGPLFDGGSIIFAG